MSRATLLWGLFMATASGLFLNAGLTGAAATCALSVAVMCSLAIVQAIEARKL